MNPTKTTPKDFFLHLGATIVLYASAIALINLVFNIINYTFPDALSGYFSSGTIAWPISMLVILIPVLYVIEWFIKKDVVRMPEKDTLWIRRWRNYLTLFLTGATIIGDLIALINTYINGEITERFVYKFLAIVIVFGIIFSYYLLDRVASCCKKTKVILALVGIIAVLAAIIGGFIIVGSPSKQRAIKFDVQRVNDLQSIQYSVVNFWQTKARLPATLAELKDSISYSSTPTDPENKSQYEYRTKGPQSFELCATFSERNQDNKGRGATYPYYNSYPMGGGSDKWDHGIGHICFERTIDPELYPPRTVSPQNIKPI